jgi:uncharacterized protein (TIGR03083 family)
VQTARRTPNNAEHLAEARSAIALVGGSFSQLVRDGVDSRPALGPWTAADVACHVSHVFQVDTDALAARPLPDTVLKPAAVSVMNETELRTDTERTPDVLADRIEERVERFLEVSKSPASDEVPWLDGVMLPASAVACHLLEELLVHGHDIAHAMKRPWTIAPEHAALALLGAAGPIVNAAPTAFIREERAKGFSARFDVRLRGQGRLTWTFDDVLTVEGPTSEPVDAHISADPSALLLVMLGRMSPVASALKGKMIVWGKRPWLLRKMLTVIVPP